MHPVQNVLRDFIFFIEVSLVFWYLWRLQSERITGDSLSSLKNLKKRQITNYESSHSSSHDDYGPLNKHHVSEIVYNAWCQMGYDVGLTTKEKSVDDQACSVPWVCFEINDILSLPPVVSLQNVSPKAIVDLKQKVTGSKHRRWQYQGL